MKRILYLLLLITSFSFQSCEKEEINPTEKTLLIYLPWSQSLYPNFQQNISDLMNAIQHTGLKGQRVMVFMCYRKTEQRDNKIYGRLFELKMNNGKCVETHLDDHSYETTGSQAEFMTSAGMSKVLTQMKQLAPAKEYSLIFGCHGEGWLPVTRSSINQNTRWVGGDYEYYQTEISTIRQALQSAGMKLKFLLFDDCYMSNVEIAYELKDVTEYLIASPTEILNYGMPYHKIGRYLLGNPDFLSVCNEFKSFYETYVNEIGEAMPYGTIGITNTSKLEDLALSMKRINAKYTVKNVSDIQKMDGYNPTIFFDYQDYINNLVTDEQDKNEISNLLKEVVPYSSHTDSYYSAQGDRTWKINTYTGLTISDPSMSSKAVGAKKNTSWWKATH